METSGAGAKEEQPTVPQSTVQLFNYIVDISRYLIDLVGLLAFSYSKGNSLEVVFPNP